MSTSAANKQQSAERAMTFDHLKSQKKPFTRTVRICLDGDLVETLNEADYQLQITKVEHEQSNGDRAVAKRLTEAQKAYDEASQAAAEHSVKFVFRSIGRKSFERLIRENPPTEDQKKRAEERGQDPGDLDWNSDTFPPALIAACIVEPALTAEQVTELYDSDDWSTAELGLLYQAAQEAQYRSSVLNLGKG